MRLKSLSLGGLSLLMLGLFPTFAWASEEVRSVEMTASAVKQYYRDRDYVSLFDALVFAGGGETKIMRPSQIYRSKKTTYFDQLSHLEPLLTQVDKVYLHGELRGIPAAYVHAPITPQEVLSSGGVIVDTVGIADKSFEVNWLSGLNRTLGNFPQNADYADLLSSSFGILRSGRNGVLKLRDAGNFSDHGWFSCAQLRIGHRLDGEIDSSRNAARQSIISAWSYGGKFPNLNLISGCRLQGFLFAAGLRESARSELESLYLDPHGELAIGPELRCAFNLLHHPQLNDGMDREKALSVLTELPKEALHCE